MEGIGNYGIPIDQSINITALKKAQELQSQQVLTLLEGASVSNTQSLPSQPQSNISEGARVLVAETTQKGDSLDLSV